jgi:hypothetical protein
LFHRAFHNPIFSKSLVPQKITYTLNETYSKSCQIRDSPEYKGIGEVPIYESLGYIQNLSEPFNIFFRAQEEQWDDGNFHRLYPVSMDLI